MENIMELLPIGSVIRLRGARKSIMIFGVCQSVETNQKNYDYIGVLWPEGNMGKESQIVFNHADIEKVEFMGYETDARKEFLVKLNAFYESQP